MLSRIKRYFEQRLLPDQEADEKTRARELQRATAALLIEVAKADFEQDDVERAAILATLRETFDLDEAMLEELVELAQAASKEANDVYQFTQLANEHYSYADKTKLVEYLWRVAFADGRLDRYEEQFIRKVAGLLHVSHLDFIKAKVDVMSAIDSENG